MNLENPGQSQRVSGVSLISGWAFSSVTGAQVTVRYQIDDIASGEIPCCVDRADVANTPEYAPYPQALRSGFGLLTNFNLLADGAHTIVVEVVETLDGTELSSKSQPVTFSTSRPGGFPFLSDLNVTTASSDEIEWDDAHQSFLIKGAFVTDQATEKEQEVNLRLGWQPNTQTLSITQSENVGDPLGGNPDNDSDGFTPPGDCNDADPTIHPGADEMCEDDVDNDCNGAIDENDRQCGASALQPIQMTLENPSATPLSSTSGMLGGIGVTSGWAFSTTPGAQMNSIRLQVDGNVVGDLPCCTNRRDVQNAYPDLPQALRSGFGALFNFNLLPSGLHTFSVEAQDSAGEIRTIDQTATTTKLANSQFLDQFDLSTATASLADDVVFLENITVRDKVTQRESIISASYLWSPSCQCFVVQQNCGNGTMETGEECDGADLKDNTCASFGFRAGAISCRPLCAADDEECFAPCTYEIKACQGSPSVYVTNTESNTVSVIDTLTNEVTATIRVGKEPRGVAVSPDGSTVYVTNFQDDTLSLIHRATNTVTDPPIPVGDGPVGVTVAPDGAHIYVVNARSGTVSVIDAVSKTPVTTITVGKEPQAIALTPDGAQAYVTNFADDSVSVLDLQTNTSIATILVGNGPDGVAVAPDGKKAYVANFESDTVSAIDTATHQVTKTLEEVGFRPVKVVVSPDSKQAFVSTAMNESVSVIDLDAFQVTRTIPTFSEGALSNPDGVALIPGGQRLYVAIFGDGFGSRVQVFSTITPTLFAEIKVGDGPFAIAVAPAL